MRILTQILIAVVALLVLGSCGSKRKEQMKQNKVDSISTITALLKEDRKGVQIEIQDFRGESSGQVTSSAELRQEILKLLNIYGRGRGIDHPTLGKKFALATDSIYVTDPDSELRYQLGMIHDLTIVEIIHGAYRLEKEEKTRVESLFRKIMKEHGPKP